MKTLPWQYFEKEVSDKKVAILPVGSIEQHGLHAPLGTDLFIAEGLAGTAEAHEDAIVLPSIPVGVAEYHRDFAGSLWVKPETLKQYVGEIIGSLIFHGIKKVIIVNGHGGNREPMKEMARYLMLDNPGISIVVWTWFESIEADIIKMYGRRPPLHADETETAMLMAIQPDSIKPEHYEESAKGAGEWGKFYKGTMVSQVVKDFSPTGATGNPALTDPERGKHMFELSKENLKELIRYMSDL
ncbi:creatininase family protein [Xylanibacillus composti]|uniref:Creatininase n=1 Tax=Xylanibacillus composti TaxID=1572762 RepID=A0A8J4H3B8_9BACL|nr:creatininase family protein [Xylanibacillus composti]MDT9726936.1 creatininase family protein [Xylanibacillus composti]GIQ70094.1 creatininase [Xylanibacillus composti]